MFIPTQLGNRGQPVVGSAVPRFVIQREPRYASWWGALSAIFSSGPGGASSLSVRFSRSLVESQAHLPRRALFTSVLLHFSIVLLLVRLSAFFAWGPTHETRLGRMTPIYYDLRVDLSQALAAVQPPGPGGRPGKGTQPDRLPARGSTAFHATLTVISNPPRPDNTRQTILQPSSPPDLRITQELRLPAVLIGNPLAVTKPRLEIRLQAPSRAALRPENQQAPPVPTLSAVPSDLPVTLVPEIKQPKLPVPPLSSLASAHVPKTGNAAASAGLGGGENAPGDAGGVLVIGVDSATMSKLLALPPGNRYGVFSISPAGGQPGSPGGVPGGSLGGGSGGAGTGGDPSTGIGPGGSGGGGGGSGSGMQAILSISGSTGSGANMGTGAAGSSGKLPAVGPASMVFPIPSPPRVRRNSLIVSAGPIGGGGLRVYGALHGGKIYTVFLPMPGKSWTLEYCLREKASSEPAPERSKSVVRLAQGLVPPDVEERFDFKRLPVPEDKADKQIVLHGVIREDGSVGELKIFQGVQSEMDEAALLAFGRWKFKPALQQAQPVAVEILVGIPVRVPKS